MTQGPMLNIDITFSEDAVENNEDYWNNDDDDYEYIGPEVPADIRKHGVSILEASNLLVGIPESDYEFIDGITIEMS